MFSNICTLSYYLNLQMLKHKRIMLDRHKSHAISDIVQMKLTFIHLSFLDISLYEKHSSPTQFPIIFILV